MLKTQLDETYFCTRPSLASFLMEQGFESEQVINPFNQAYKKAWLFQKSNALMNAVAKYFGGGANNE